MVLVTADPEEPEQQRLITQAKANWARAASVQRHVLEEIQLDRLDPATGAPIVTSRMRFLEEAVDVDRNGVLGEQHRERDGAGGAELGRAMVFLTRMLEDGAWHDSAGLKQLAGAQAITERTLQRAARELGFEHQRKGFPASTCWRDASRATTSPADAGATADDDANPHGYAETPPTPAQSRQSRHGERDAGTTGGSA